MYMPFLGVTNEVRTRSSLRGLIWAAVIATCLWPKLAFGQTNSAWNGGTGNWSNATDWTPNQTPNNGGGNTYNVTIDSGGTDTVTLDQNATINSLVLGGMTGTSVENLSGTAETLNITGSLTVNGGSITFSNGSSLVAAANSSSAGLIDLENGSSMNISGNFTNLGELDTNKQNQTNGKSNTITVTGTLTNSGFFNVGGFNGITSDVANVGTLVNTGLLVVGTGATLNLTSQPNGITDVVAGSEIMVLGTINAGTNNGLVNLASVEGIFALRNGQSLTLNPSTLTVSSTGNLGLGNASSLTVANLTNSGNVSTGNFASRRSILTVTGTLTNNADATLRLGEAGKSNDVANIGTLVNNGNVFIDFGATLNLTNQPNGITDVVQGSSLTLQGTLSAGAENGLANLNSVEGALSLQNRQTTTVTPSSGTLTESTTGNLTVSFGTTALTVIGNVNNAGKLTISKGNTFTIDGPNGYSQTAGTANVSGTLDIMSAGMSMSGGTILDSGLIKTDSFTQMAGATTVNGTLDTGSYTQTAGTTTVKGTLSVASPGGVNVSGGSVLDTGTITTGSYTQTAGTTTVNGSLSATSPRGVDVSGGSVFGIGTITGNIDLTGGLLSPGAASKKAGGLTVSGTYTQSGAGAFDVDLGGTTAGTQYDLLNITSTATLGGTLNVDLISGFKPTVGESFDIMNYTSETGTFTTTNLPKVTGDHWTVTYNATDVVLTLVAGPAAASATAHGAGSASPATRVSRNMGASAMGTREPVAILSRVSCLGARWLGLTSCGTELIAGGASRGERHQLPSVVAGGGTIHNNVMVTTHSISTAGGASHQSSVPATSMARFYVCAYLPSTVARTMGCN